MSSTISKDLLARILVATPEQIEAIERILNRTREKPKAPTAQATATPAPVTAAEPYISKGELAKRIGKNVRTIMTYMNKGFIPYYKLGHTVVFKYSEVEKQLTMLCRKNQGLQSGRSLVWG